MQHAADALALALTEFMNVEPFSTCRNRCGQKVSEPTKGRS
jgi:Holliday junction resolvasome RuvABC endonuclease subunit